MPRKKAASPAKKGLSPSARSTRSQRVALAPSDEGARDRMVSGAALLLAKRGLQATSFSEVLELTSAPRGSVYHHFPDGKDQLVNAALDRVDAQMGQMFAPNAGASPEEVATLFLHLWRTLLRRSGFTVGCAVVAVTVATDSPELLKHAGDIFRAWRSRLTTLFVEGGLPRERATRLAATLIAASEGAVILSRAEQSLEPFELVAAQLIDQIRGLS